MSQLELHFDIKTSLMFFQKYEIPSNHAVYIFLKKPPKPQLQKQSHV